MMTSQMPIKLVLWFFARKKTLFAPLIFIGQINKVNGPFWAAVTLATGGSKLEQQKDRVSLMRSRRRRLEPRISWTSETLS